MKEFVQYIEQHKHYDFLEKLVVENKMKCSRVPFSPKLNQPKNKLMNITNAGYNVFIVQ